MNPSPSATHTQEVEDLELNDDFVSSGQVSNLPPTDGGPQACRLLIAAFVFEALLWGFPLSFGVFQDYYSSLPEFKDNRYTSVIGTTASGISYLGAPLAMPLIRRWSKYRVHMICVGWPLCILGLVAGSFAHSLATLIFTQGVLYGVGFIICELGPSSKDCPIVAVTNIIILSRTVQADGDPQSITQS